MPAKNREQMLIILVLSCVGLLVADRLIFTPLIETWRTRSKQITQLESDLNHGRQLLANNREKTMQDRWRQMVKDSVSTVDSDTEAKILNAVGNWAISSRLTVTAIKPHWITSEENCRKLEIRVSATGNLSSIARFLYSLESDTQPLKVEDLELSSKDDNGQTINCEVRFTRLVLEESKKS